jgi:amino acid adenylation domain-containing protein
MQTLAIEYLRNTARKFPERIAVVDNGREIRFAELWERAVSLAVALLDTEPRRNLPVLIDIPKSIEAVVALVAVQLTGNIYVPVDTATPPARKESMLGVLGAHGRLGWNGGAFTLNDRVPAAPQISGADSWPAAVAARVSERNSTDPLYIIFTSGTTGTPKGVTIANASVIDYIDWAARTYDVTERDVIANQAPLFFDNSVLDLYLMMARGCTLHLLPNPVLMFPATLVEYLRDHSITFLFFVPSLLNSFASLDMMAQYSLPSLQKILFAGEVMPLPTLKYLRRHFPNALLSNLYGPTEITVDAIYWIAGDAASLEELESVPLGRPCENSAILFVDENNVPVTAPDTMAEICVGGVGVGLGYWNNPAKSAEVFIQHPGHNSYRDIVYKTGDLGLVSSRDGLIYFGGRRDHQIKHQGYRIELGEIETALQSIPGLHQCCVLYDNDRREIVAFHSAAAGLDAARIQKELRRLLPAYMIPRRCLPVETFPLTPNGKVDRAALWKHHLESSHA